MEKTDILWIDLRANHDHGSYRRFLRADWKVSCISDTDKLDLALHQDSPTLLCFEFDYPDIPGLSTLRRTRQLHPTLPTIMLTEQHSESLAVWALRARVWDYFVKPLPYHELNNSAAVILARSTPATFESIPPPRPSNPLPAEVRFRPNHRKRTDPALAFMEKHSHEKIYEKKVAELCGMKTSAFSRCFKKGNGITFRDYLIGYRIKNSCRLLLNPGVSVSDIAYAAGFHDPSYFTRTFRRLIGMSPSRYRESHERSDQPIESPG